ncbi:MAG: hypothetical protein WA961_10960, partial [Rhodanobacter sp.]
PNAWRRRCAPKCSAAARSTIAASASREPTDTGGGSRGRPPATPRQADLLKSAARDGPRALTRFAGDATPPAPLVARTLHDG